MTNRIITYKVPIEYHGKSIACFLRSYDYPESILTTLRKKDGLLCYNGFPVHMNHVFSVFEEGVLTVTIPEEDVKEKITPVNLHFEIIYEDEDILVVNKPAPMPTHPSLNNYNNTLANAVAYYFSLKNQSFVFRCINRLDKATTGLTIIAKNSLSAAILSKAMQERRIKREYTAIVEGLPQEREGTIDLPIGRVDASLITREINLEKGEKAVTHYRVADTDEVSGLSVVKLILETGRTHQIRVHMQALGHPLVGDYLYNPTSTLMNRQALHAGHLEFEHPINHENMLFDAPLPLDMLDLINQHKQSICT